MFSFVFDCWSLLGENRNRDLNLYQTVLEGYWELEARTGTVEKLQVSTFSFSENVFSKNKNFSWKVDKTVWIYSQIEWKSDPKPTFWDGRLMRWPIFIPHISRYAKLTFCASRYTNDTSLVQFWSPSDQKWRCIAGAAQKPRVGHPYQCPPRTKT